MIRSTRIKRALVTSARTTERTSKESKRRQLQLSHLLHEMRAPLARMRVAVGLLNQSKKIVRADMNRLCLEIERIETMTREVSDWDRLMHTVRHDSNECYSLTKLVQSVIADLKYESRVKKINIDLSLARDVDAHGDELWMRRSIENILRNALKYSPANGRIGVKLECLKKVARLSISDSGPGVDKQDLEKIFDPFYRCPATASLAKDGMGLGLSISKNVVTLHGGTILAKTTASGLMVIVELPVNAKTRH